MTSLLLAASALFLFSGIVSLCALGVNGASPWIVIPGAALIIVGILLGVGWWKAQKED